MLRYISEISSIYRYFGGYRHDTCRRNIGHLVISPNLLKWPKTPTLEGRVAQPTPPNQHSSIAQRALTPTHHAPLQC